MSSSSSADVLNFACFAPFRVFCTVLYLHRKRAASTNSTPNSSLMNQSLITSSHWKSRRKSTRLNGVNDRTKLTSCSRPMVRCLTFHGPYMVTQQYLSRQNNQTLESLRKVTSCCFWIKPSWWYPPATSPIKSVTSTTSSNDTSREYHCCGTPQSLRKCTCLSHTFDLRQFRSGDVHFRRRSANQFVESQY